MDSLQFSQGQIFLNELNLLTQDAPWQGVKLSHVSN
jgi:hypothetical protein